ncbi:MAG: tetratricopeptide repeat protein [Candidatus Hydrogenedentes bacterium]|nr:tetratricopeptide repeat protein [Candidatus Hydrogenedentota bacterium]
MDDSSSIEPVPEACAPQRGAAKAAMDIPSGLWPVPEVSASRRGASWAACGLAGLVLLVFLQVRTFGFLDYDDGRIVSEHPVVQQGFHLDTVWWAFGHFHFGLYMPLTTLTHLLDVSLFGHWAGGHHLSSVLLHALNSVLLFLALSRLTGAPWPSLAAAALFAVHPLRVESVAWVASRKDLVSGVFFMFALLAYARFAGRPTVRAMLPVIAFYAAALLSKPTVLPLPLVLLLLDWWPLQRMDTSNLRAWRHCIKLLLLEKLPLFLLGLGAALITLMAEHSLETLPDFETFPLAWRLENALLSLVRYLGHFLCPLSLSIHYPQVLEWLGTLAVVGAALLLMFLTLAVLLLRQRRYLAVGWLWFVVLLVPVIGIVQFGSASMADRFMYLPQIGLNVMLVWGSFDLVRTARQRRVLGGVWVSVILVLALLTWWQTGFWRDTRTVFTRALAATQDNDVAYSKLGDLALAAGRAEEALGLFQRAAEIRPENPEAHYNLGCALLDLGRDATAAAAFARAVESRPDNAGYQMNLGVAQLKLGQTDAALARLAEAVRLAPDHVNARINYGVALLRAGRIPESIQHLEEAVRLEPGNATAGANLALALQHQRQP